MCFRAYTISVTEVREGDMQMNIGFVILTTNHFHQFLEALPAYTKTETTEGRR